MTRTELEKIISEAVEDYIAAEESYDDMAQLCIDPVEMRVWVDDSGEVDPDSETIDSYDVMDFVVTGSDAADPGKWTVDSDAVTSVATEYIPLS